jgi:hypothetical protein
MWQNSDIWERHQQMEVNTQEEIKNLLYLENACYSSIQNLFFFYLVLSESVKIAVSLKSVLITDCAPLVALK